MILYFARRKTKTKFEKSNFEKIFSIEEQNNWFAASDKKGFSSFCLWT
jgi:hypothetical protein